MSNARILRCPTCKKPVALDTPDMPFCSGRCRLLDLGAWASGNYRISSPVMDPELLEELDAAELQAARRAEDQRSRED